MGRKGNAGSFRPGPDPRRHHFTRAECRRGGKRGFAAALDRHGERLYEWLIYRAKGRARPSYGSCGARK